jgi:hypothetical protein
VEVVQVVMEMLLEAQEVLAVWLRALVLWRPPVAQEQIGVSLLVMAAPDQTLMTGLEPLVITAHWVL